MLPAREGIGCISVNERREFITLLSGAAVPGGSLTLGGDTTVNRLGFGAMRLCGPGVWGEPLDRPGAKRGWPLQ